MDSDDMSLPAVRLRQVVPFMFIGGKMGLFNSIFGAPRKGIYLLFTCLKCDSKIENEIYTTTLPVLKASIREPQFCMVCYNKTQFRYDGIRIFERQ